VLSRLATGTAVLPAVDAEVAPPVTAPAVSGLARAGEPAVAGESRWHALARSRWSLPAILAVQALLSLRLVWANTAFQDEALYLWAGHLEWSHWLHGTPVPDFPFFFSGAPVLYPPIGAVADSIGGLALARVLSLVFMLIATTLLYRTARRLLADRTAALCAAGVFALLGPTQALAFATYDAMALLLIAVAAWLAVRSAARHPEPFLLLAGLVMALANATKYASALWDPAVLALAVVASWQAGRWRRLARAARIGCYTAAALGVALFGFGGHGYERGIMFTTLARSNSTTPAATVLGAAFGYIGPLLVLAGLGLAASLGAGNRVRVLCASATAAVLAAPVEQARIHTLTSLHKHVDFGAWFGAIAAGYVIARVSRIDRRLAWKACVSLGLAIPVALLGVSVANRIYHGWPPSSGMIAALRPLVRPDGAHYLIEEYNVASYYLPDRVYPGQITGLFAFSFWDAARHRELTGPGAYQAAISAGYFSVIELDGSTLQAATEGVVAKAVARSGRYRLVYQAREKYTSRHFFRIWRLSSA
jgi:4-amino-4-deoxy-L-arabinose transferase-like glycosyltransferase